MIFENLSSEVIKQGLYSKMNFSLGYKAIAAQIKSKKPIQKSFETGEDDFTPVLQAANAKRSFNEFQQEHSHDAQLASLEEIISTYIKNTSNPIVAHIPDHILALRAKVSGINTTKLKETANQKAESEAAKIEEKVKNLIADMSDIKTYKNAGFDAGGDSALEDSDWFPDEWVIENYPKVLKSQIAFWTRYNNWDDAELILIEADQQLMESSKK